MHKTTQAIRIRNTYARTGQSPRHVRRFLAVQIRRLVWLVAGLLMATTLIVMLQYFG